MSGGAYIQQWKVVALDFWAAIYLVDPQNNRLWFRDVFKCYICICPIKYLKKENQLISFQCNVRLF